MSGMQRNSRPNVLETLESRRLMSTAIYIGVAAVADFTADGIGDLLTADEAKVDGKTMYRVRELDAAGSVVGSQALGTTTFGWIAQAATDMDQDGDADIIWQNTETRRSYIWFMDETRVESHGFINAGRPPLHWLIKGAGDFDADGYGDILWGNTDGAVVIWRMRGQNVLGVHTVRGATPGALADVLDVGDVDGDGRADIVWHAYDRGQAMAYLWPEQTLPDLSQPAHTLRLYDTGVVGFAAGDINGDGAADVVAVAELVDPPTKFKAVTFTDRPIIHLP